MDYVNLFREFAERRNSLLDEKDKIESELAGITPMLQWAYNMLTPAQRASFGREIDSMDKRAPGLKQGVLMAFKAHSGKWLTPPQVRDYLESIGFDFGSDSARGLTSVGTTLRRMTPTELETKEMENGQVAYKLIRRFQSGDIAKAMGKK